MHPHDREKGLHEPRLCFSWDAIHCLWQVQWAWNARYTPFGKRLSSQEQTSIPGLEKVLAILKWGFLWFFSISRAASSTGGPSSRQAHRHGHAACGSGQVPCLPTSWVLIFAKSHTSCIPDAVSVLLRTSTMQNLDRIRGRRVWSYCYRPVSHVATSSVDLGMI